MYHDENVKSEGVGCLRGLLFACTAPMVGVGLGIWVGYNYGTFNGIMSGIGGAIGTVIIGGIISQIKGRLTYVDCLIPLVLSIIAGIAFAPISLFTLSLFSWATCIASGFIMSMGLIFYKQKRIHKGWLIIPAISFMYECLPIDLPTDIDNVISVGGSAMSVFLNVIKVAGRNSTNIE